jgi:single-strand DNA-binding protein
MEIRYSQSAEPIAILRNSIAVNRMKKDEADFISVLAFGKTAENIDKFFKKGDLIAIQGHIQTGKYDKDGTTIYTTEVIIDRFHFTGGKKEESAEPQKYDPVGVSEVVEDDSDLPF